MNYEKYKNPIPYPSHPRKPTLEGKTAKDARKYADEMDAHEVAFEAYSVKKKEYFDEQSMLMQQFREDALAEVGLTGHPKADSAFAYAYEHGHAEGLQQVFVWLEELAELLK